MTAVSVGAGEPGTGVRYGTGQTLASDLDQRARLPASPFANGRAGRAPEGIGVWGSTMLVLNVWRT